MALLPKAKLIHADGREVSEFFGSITQLENQESRYTDGR
jgi:hypothetical protein